MQTFDESIQALISRKQNNQKSIENLKWLRESSHAHIHSDLIFGLPGDTLENFAESFALLVSLNPHEIQLGILKRLRGVPLNRHNETYDMRYNPEAPYNILRTRDIDFETMQRVNRFARYWDMIANSGRFKSTLPLILDGSPFESFMRLSDSLYLAAGSTWKISQQRLFVLIYESLRDRGDVDEALLLEVLLDDYERTGEKASFESLINRKDKVTRIGIANKRQLKVLQ